MNEDVNDMAAAEPLAGEELERMLARFARVRLEPSPSQVRRARAAVMEDAWRRRIASRAAPASTRRRLFSAWTTRRLGTAFSAAVLAGLMIGSSAFAASRAGGPLYEARLAVEALSLPSGPARVDAQLEAAQARLAEAVEASGRHDAAATSAALSAYDRTIDELTTAEGGAAERALEAVQFHHGVLLEIAGNVPDAASSGLERALLNSERVIDRLAAGGNPGGIPNGNPGGKPTSADEPTAKPGRTKDPDATPKPARPEKTPQPHKTPDPDRSRQPAPPKGNP